jgi:L-lactate dehydrogenase
MNAGPLKVSVVGCGNVGAAAAYAMLLDGTPTELALMDRDAKKLEGLHLDLEHSLSFFETARISASDQVEVCAGSDLIVVTAGARQREGESRLDLIGRNREIFGGLIPSLVKVAPDAIFMIVSNPVDVLTFETLRLSGLPSGRVFGTGTTLDTARFQFHLSQKIGVSPASIQAYILGEHGDSSFPVLSSANVAGEPLLNFKGMDEALALEAFRQTQEAAARIIQSMGYTAYSIGVVVKELMNAIFKNSRKVFPVSTVLQGEYGLSEIALSVPCVLDRSGISEVLTVSLNEQEKNQLQKSAEVLRGLL